MLSSLSGIDFSTVNIHLSPGSILGNTALGIDRISEAHPPRQENIDNLQAMVQMGREEGFVLPISLILIFECELAPIPVPP